MWILCKDGFFSIVQLRPDQAHPASGFAHPDHSDVLCVRTRKRDDLERFCQALELDPGSILGPESYSGDYPFRVFVHRDDVAFWLGSVIGSLDYTNFKEMVHRVFGSARASIYTSVWSSLCRLYGLPKGQ